MKLRMPVMLVVMESGLSTVEVGYAALGTEKPHTKMRKNISQGEKTAKSFAAEQPPPPQVAADLAALALWR